MPQANQIDNKRDDVSVSQEQLIEVPGGEKTVGNVRHCLRVAVQYLEAWLRGSGCVPLYNLMEDAATAEISRMQIWQWIRHSVQLDDGRTLTTQRFRSLLDEEMEQIRLEVGESRFQSGKFAGAKDLLENLTANESCEDFLTIPAYEQLISQTKENINVQH
jgi:malate synthase